MARKTKRRGSPPLVNKSRTETLGARVRRLRTECGLASGELCRRIGRHPSWLSHVESGRRGIGLESARLLASALNVTVEELLQGCSGGRNE